MQGSGEMTLALSFEAVKRLAEPTAAFEQAMAWSEYVGIVSSRPQPVVLKFARDHDLPTHFMPRPDGRVAETLADVRGVSTEYDETDRYVFVGTTGADREAAAAAGWEYRTIEEVAEATGWDLVEAPDEPADGTSPGVQLDDTSSEDWP